LKPFAAREPPMSPAPPPADPARVLVVEDNPETRWSLRLLLSLRGSSRRSKSREFP